MPSTPAHRVVVSLLTPPGRGALAVVGVAGATAAAAVDGAFSARGGGAIRARDAGAIAFGTWRSTGEEVIVTRSADAVEVHCHGGRAAAEAVVASLVAGGAEEVPWIGWLAAAGRPATVVEAHQALASAGGPKAARILARQLAGAFDRECGRIADSSARGDAAGVEAAVGRLLRAARVGLRLTTPWRVVLCGPVNVGKSSLVNALAGHARSIVSPEPGTTRDAVETRLVVAGWEIDLVDTAGMRDGTSHDAVEREGIARARDARNAADLVLRAVAAADPGLGGLRAAPGELLVVTKGDLVPAGAAVPHGALVTSAVTGSGIDALAARIAEALVPEETAEPSLFEGAVPFTLRQVEMLRGFLAPQPGRRGEHP